MRFDFHSDELRELFDTGACKKLHLHPEVIQAFFRVLRTMTAAPDERQLRANAGLRMEKLRGDRERQYSVRLNDQFRLIFTIQHDENGNIWGSVRKQLHILCRSLRRLPLSHRLRNIPDMP